MIKLDIEKLLQWALREEMPKGHAVSASAWDTITRFATLGVRVDVSRGGGDGLGFVPGEPHPDAEIVADAVRSLPAETRLSDAECVAMLGCYAALDPLAVKAIAGSVFSMRAPVIRCAVLGERMPFDIGTPRVAPSVKHDRQRWAVAFVRDDEGVLREARANGRGNYPAGAATHLKWHEPSIGQLLEVRAEYAIWHRALMRLYRDLVARDASGDGMREHVAVAPLAHAEPWRTGQVSEPIVLKGDDAPAGICLPLVPARKRALRPVEARIVTERRARYRARRKGASSGNQAGNADGIGAN